MKKPNMLLKVTGILMIISGALGIVFACVAVLGSVLPAISSEEDKSYLMIASVLLLVFGIVRLIAGILGVKNAGLPEKAGICIVFGVLASVQVLVMTFIDLESYKNINILLEAAKLALPILYLFGAAQNKEKQAESSGLTHNSEGIQ